MPSDLDRVVTWSKRFETHLERRYGATGRGLHEKLDSVERRLPREAVRDLRYLATIRNKIVHDADYKRLDDRREFKARVRRAAKKVRLRRGLVATLTLGLLGGG
ncbi:MAG: DUF4145 domain-containing protein [Planctomycetota bacterium]